MLTFQPSLCSRLLACFCVGFRKHSLGVTQKRPAFQELPQLALLFQDGRLPGATSPLGLEIPLKQVNEQHHESADDLAAITPGHVREVLRKVAGINFA